MDYNFKWTTRIQSYLLDDLLAALLDRNLKSLCVPDNTGSSKILQLFLDAVAEQQPAITSLQSLSLSLHAAITSLSWQALLKFLTLSELQIFSSEINTDIETLLTNLPPSLRCFKFGFSKEIVSSLLQQLQDTAFCLLFNRVEDLVRCCQRNSERLSGFPRDIQ